jgi:predicted nucleotidyltransferase
VARLPDDALAALVPMPAGYVALLDSAVDLLAARAEVRAVWLSGSVGRGAADAGSDLDLVVTVVDDGFEALADPAFWSPLDPLLCLALSFLPGAAVITTRDGLRLDVVLERVSELASTPYRRRLVVLDRDGLEVPEPEPPPGPDPRALADLVTEFLRQSAIFPAAVLAREDWLLGQESVVSYRGLLYRIFLEANQPLPPMGVKQWSSRLTAGQREVLATVPLPAPDRESVVECIVLARRALRAHGRAAVEGAGGTWPVELDESMAALWRRAGLAD